MNRIRNQVGGRAPTLIALALFLIGSNYCLLSGWNGRTPMACLGVGRVTNAKAIPACHQKPAGKTGAPAAKRSCCPDPIVVPSAPAHDAASHAVVTGVSAALSVLAPEPATPLGGVWRGHPPARDGRPPTDLTRAPLPARAPPLT
jgi:hypothetical protein